MLLIGEVGRIPPALFLVVPAGKVRRQVDEREHCGRHRAQVLHRLVGRGGKNLGKALDGLLAVVPQAFHARFHLAAVAVLHRGEARKRDGHAARGVPALCGLPLQRFKLVGRVEERGRILLVQRVIRAHLLRRALQKVFAVARLAPHLIEQNFSIGRVLDLIRHGAPKRALRLEPFVLIRLRLQFCVQLEH